MLARILQKLSFIVVLGRLNTIGFFGYILLSFIPFIGVTLLGWDPVMILIGYFVDRIIYLLFLWLMNRIMLKKSNRLKTHSSFKDLLVILVGSYMLLQFGALFYSFGGTLEPEEQLNELAAITVCIVFFYGYQFYVGLQSINPHSWVNNILTQTIGIVLLSGFLALSSLFLAIFLAQSVNGTFAGSFFQSGYGIMIFVFIAFRLVSDFLFFSFFSNSQSSN